MEKIKKVVAYLEGKKTYAIGAVAILVIVANLGGVLEAELANTLLGLLGFGGLITLRHGLAAK